MRVFVLLALASWLPAADWLSSSSDPKRTRSQPAETELSRETIRDLKLLWNLHFDEPITAPVVLGPIYTHRGIKELVFFGGEGDNLYAVDADLARIVWKRHFESEVPGKLSSAPVLAPFYGAAPEGDDASTPRRSLFALTSDGKLHTVRPADGHDLSLPVSFVPPGSAASDLMLKSNVVSTDVLGKTWSIRVDASAKPVVTVAAPEKKMATWNGYQVLISSSTLTVSNNARPAWSVNDLEFPLAPVIANDLVFVVSGARLVVFDLASGLRLYNSTRNGIEPATASLALANGHVYFIAGQTIYCYGLPLEI